MRVPKKSVLTMTEFPSKLKQFCIILKAYSLVEEMKDTGKKLPISRQYFTAAKLTFLPIL